MDGTGGWLRASSSDPFLRSLLLGGLVCGVVEVDPARPSVLYAAMVPYRIRSWPPSTSDSRPMAVVRASRLEFVLSFGAFE